MVKEIGINKLKYFYTVGLLTFWYFSLTFKLLHGKIAVNKLKKNLENKSPLLSCGKTFLAFQTLPLTFELSPC